MTIPILLDPDDLLDYLLGDPDPYDHEELLTALGRVGRDHGPYVVAVLHTWGELLPRHAGVVVPDVWSGVEHPLAALDRGAWRKLFDYAGYTFNGRRRARPRLSRVLFRGADEAHRDGWSWTDDRDLAQWFADRDMHKAPGRVWQATVDPSRLLARITSVREGESEYVVDTDGLAITSA